MKPKIIMVALADLHVDESKSPRMYNAKFEKEQFNHLTESIKKLGMRTPIIIDKSYNLIVGFRRLKAAKRLKWKEVPCIISDADPFDTNTMHICCGGPHQRLTADELADELRKLRKEGKTVKEIANLVWMSERTVYRYLARKPS